MVKSTRQHAPFAVQTLNHFSYSTPRSFAVSPKTGFAYTAPTFERRYLGDFGNSACYGPRCWHVYRCEVDQEGSAYYSAERGNPVTFSAGTSEFRAVALAFARHGAEQSDTLALICAVIDEIYAEDDTPTPGLLALADKLDEEGRTEEAALIRENVIVRVEAGRIVLA